MIEILNGDASILKTALKDAIAFNVGIAESKEIPDIDDDIQPQTVLDARAKAKLFFRMLTKLNRRMRAGRNMDRAQNRRLSVGTSL